MLLDTPTTLSSACRHYGEKWRSPHILDIDSRQPASRRRLSVRLSGTCLRNLRLSKKSVSKHERYIQLLWANSMFPLAGSGKGD